LPIEDVIKKHISGVQSGDYKFMELYYKMTKVLDVENAPITINQINKNEESKIAELEIVKIINKDPLLKEKFQNIIEASSKEDKE